MQLLAALIASFVALAAANPVADLGAREPQVVCDTLPFLRCQGGINQQVACQAIPWTCSSTGATPVISDATCAADCVCEVPCAV
ncbi:hypothetical protein FB45DRAFT_1024528 [Roridomyces roridus]|uniref:Uncharacterized protein n=1 Tax=Roridomyces roridus TaxID=1738132 RepID=A0AAD7FS69_9AGAR|nr:hypothetical protein FB45DRAFT_1024528 [Roridomyces roridus]